MFLGQRTSGLITHMSNNLEYLLGYDSPKLLTEKNCWILPDVNIIISLFPLFLPISTKFAGTFYVGICNGLKLCTLADASFCPNSPIQSKPHQDRLDSIHTVQFELWSKSIPPKLWEISSFRPVLTKVLVRFISLPFTAMIRMQITKNTRKLFFIFCVLIQV